MKENIEDRTLNIENSMNQSQHRHRHLPFLLILAVVPALTVSIALAHPQSEPRASSSVADIRALLTKQADAWNRGDIDGFMEGYNRSAATLFVSGDTITRGWRPVRDRYKKKYTGAEKMGRLQFSQVEIARISPDAAIATGRWQLRRKADNPRGRFTLLFRRTPAGWRIVHDHTSSASP